MINDKYEGNSTVYRVFCPYLLNTFIAVKAALNHFSFYLIIEMKNLGGK